MYTVVINTCLQRMRVNEAHGVQIYLSHKVIVQTLAINAIVKQYK